MREMGRRAGLVGLLAIVVLVAAGLGAGSVLLLSRGTHTTARLDPTQTALPTIAMPSPTATATRAPTPTPRRLPTPTPTPVPTQLLFDCASAVKIDPLAKSYSLTLCFRTSPPRPYYYVNTYISSCSQTPGPGTSTSQSTHLDYAGKQTVQGIPYTAKCDPPLTIVITATSMTYTTTQLYPLVGSASIAISN